MQISEQQYILMQDHLRLVLECNEIHNLTNITNPIEAEELHIKDSLNALEEIEKINPHNILDMGSGAGFPGIPLCVATGINTTLVETTKKKSDCLEYFINKLFLENKVSVINDRIENLHKKYNQYFELITARALSSIPSLLELAAPLNKINGYMLCYKGSNYEDEINGANDVAEKLGYKLLSVRTYNLPLTNKIHNIILYKKVKQHQVKLPRKLGFAQKHPLA